MSQYQRMVSYLYEYKQGVKGVNVGYVRIEERGTGCRISLQMRSRNLGQLSDVAVFRQMRDGIRYHTIGTLTEKNGDYRCRIETESGNLMGSGIDFLDVDGIVIYQNDSYYIATTWKNQSVYLGESRIWNPEESEESEDSEELENVESELTESGESPEDDQMILEQSDIQDMEQEMSQQLSERNDSSSYEQEILTQNDIQQIVDADSPKDHEQQVVNRDGSENHQQTGFDGDEKNGQQYGIPGMRQIFPRWMGMPLFGRRPVGNGNIPIPQMAEWSNGSRHMEESGAEKHVENMGDVKEPSSNRSSCDNRRQIEEQAVCRNCPFKRKNIDYGKRILMTFPVMRPFPNDQQLACVRIEPQDLGCLPMQMWTLANNHFLLQGYYCYRHLIFMETGKQGYALGVPGIYDRRTSRQAEQFGFMQFRAICSGKQCDGAFGYWLMPLSC